MPKPIRLKFILSALLFFLFTYLSAEELDSLKSVTENWIQTRNRVSKERIEWREEKELLQSTIQTLSSTRDTLARNVSVRATQTQKLEADIELAEQQLQSFDSTYDLVGSRIIEFETRIRSIATFLPDPLLEKIGPLLRKIPADGKSDLASPNRLQNIVAISTLIDEFNNNLTLSNTIRDLGNGATSQVRVLYWGLAGGYALSSDGSVSWVLQPASNGWKWIPAKEANEAIQQLFDVYDKSIDPIQVQVPFTLLENPTSEEGIE